MYSLFIYNASKAWTAMRALLAIFFVYLRRAISANTHFFRRELVVQFPLGCFVVAALFKMH